MDQLRRYFEDNIPLHVWLGLKVVELARGRCILEVPFRRELVGDAERPALHGGVLSTLADAAGGLAVYSQMDDPGTGRTSTVDLRVDYLRPGALQDLRCEAQVLRMGNRVAVARMVLTQGDHLPAEARGVYNVIRGTGTSP